jgi:hypothetical protein
MREIWFIVVWLAGLPIMAVAGAFATMVGYTCSYFSRWPGRRKPSELSPPGPRQNKTGWIQ